MARHVSQLAVISACFLTAMPQSAFSIREYIFNSGINAVKNSAQSAISRPEVALSLATSLYFIHKFKIFGGQKLQQQTANVHANGTQTVMVQEGYNPISWSVPALLYSGLIFTVNWAIWKQIFAHVRQNPELSVAATQVAQVIQEAGAQGYNRLKDFTQTEIQPIVEQYAPSVLKVFQALPDFSKQGQDFEQAWSSAQETSNLEGVWSTAQSSIETVNRIKHSLHTYQHMRSTSHVLPAYSIEHLEPARDMLFFAHDGAKETMLKFYPGVATPVLPEYLVRSISNR